MSKFRISKTKLSGPDFLAERSFRNLYETSVNHVDIRLQVCQLVWNLHRIRTVPLKNVRATHNYLIRQPDLDLNSEISSIDFTFHLRYFVREVVA